MSFSYPWAFFNYRFLPPGLMAFCFVRSHSCLLDAAHELTLFLFSVNRRFVGRMIGSMVRKCDWCCGTRPVRRSSTPSPRRTTGARRPPFWPSPPSTACRSKPSAPGRRRWRTSAARFPWSLYRTRSTWLNKPSSTRECCSYTGLIQFFSIFPLSIAIAMEVT